MDFENSKLEEKKSGLNRVVGLDKESQNAVEEHFSSQKQDFRELYSLGDTREREKYEKLIGFLNKSLQEFLVGYGLREAQNFTMEDVIINPEERLYKFPEAKADTEFFATYHSVHSKIYIRDIPDENDAQAQGDFLGFLSHEMIHGQAFDSATLSKTDNNDAVEVRPRRSGLISHKSRNSERVGNWLNEAVTEELNVRFLKFLLQDSDTSEELKPFIQSYLVTTMSVYPDERIVFHSILKSMQQSDLDQYQDLEDVFRLFSKAALNGKLLLLARSMKKALGKKSLRAYIGMSDEVVEAAANNLVASIFTTEESGKDT